MKTAISIPDPIFSAAERLAKRLRVSRSKLYAAAMAKFIEAHKSEGVTVALNKVYAMERSSVDKALAAIQAASVPREKW